ncbi:MAG: Hsp20/alpha crystallin family protein [Gemmatimonadales bacterium]|nr:Hsp20/alpha crystallin family protein [Gemmatimonadales bacterium]
MNTLSTMIPMSRMIDAALNNHFEAFGQDDPVHTASPRADILEGAHEFRIVMDMPGIKSEDLDINLENQLLVVKAERKWDIPEEFESRRRERADHTAFSRSFTLSNAVEMDQISAQLNDGVLQLVLPKSEKSLPRRIEIK